MGVAWGAGAGPAVAMLQRQSHPQTQRHSSQGASCSSSAAGGMDPPKFLKSMGPALYLDSFQHHLSVNAGVISPGMSVPGAGT